LIATSVLDALIACGAAAQSLSPLYRQVVVNCDLLLDSRLRLWNAAEHEAMRVQTVAANPRIAPAARFGSASPGRRSRVFLIVNGSTTIGYPEQERAKLSASQCRLKLHTRTREVAAQMQ
jgi:hypothetical protein